MLMRLSWKAMKASPDADPIVDPGRHCLHEVRRALKEETQSETAKEAGNEEPIIGPKDVLPRRLDAKPRGPLSRQWGGRESTAIEYAGVEGQTYFCIRRSDGAEQWFIAEERTVARLAR